MYGLMAKEAFAAMAFCLCIHLYRRQRIKTKSFTNYWPCQMLFTLKEPEQKELAIVELKSSKNICCLPDEDKYYFLFSF